ncbi:RRP12-like protein [Diorhabda carinulata]|uniref:RRP12-like protein n=1 Tax=Diorhabda carinulata TaxID=1163345 RepID=UPI0025A1C0C3|nr:RRP12-like protein [Diorhabda carinulata]XP_057657542.1 RRP12-like protein [Diorhabda carinulata]
MGKFRSKLKGQSKGKRWPKGQSSSSNPGITKYRDIAKSRFFQENLGPSNLTSDALRKHDAIQSFVPKAEEPAKMEEDAESSIGTQSSYMTMKSFASEWSNCSNMSFNRFLTVFRSDSALHKEMLAILAGITDVIKEQGGTGTSTEYYCCLITTLKEVYNAEEKNEDQITALLALLNMGIKTVPDGVLKKYFDDITLKMLHILKDYSDGDNNTIMKSIFGILGHLLKIQELALWYHGYTVQIFNALLNPFCIHTKPKWRKAAQRAVSIIITSGNCLKENSSNPAADKAAEFCEQTLDSCMGGTSGTVLVSSVQAGQTTILHILGLMKDIICYFSKNHIKKCCESILKLMTLNYPIVTSCGMQVLYALFSAQRTVVPAKLNAQLISALYEYQPSISDVQPTQAWVTVMQQAHVHLSDVDVPLAMAALPKIFDVLTHLWLSEKAQIMTSATHALEILLKDALINGCTTKELVEQHRSKIEKCIQSIQIGLSYQYNASWHQVLHVISVLFEVAGGSCSEMLLGLLTNLAELRDSYKFSYNNELEHAVGAAIRSMGPEIVLDVISLKKPNGDLNIDRSWLLPVLKENIRFSTLDYFVKGILPLALFCHRRSALLAQNNDGIGAHSSELLYLQLWNLLPCFCNCPSDIKDNFKTIAKVMGTAISDKKELRLAVMAALRKLISSAKNSNNEEDLQELSRFDKNYLPILFNVYTTKPIGTDEEGQRLAALETIKLYLSIARSELTQQLFVNAIHRLNSSSDEPEDHFIKESILDLIRALVPYQNASNIEILYQQCIKNLPEIKNNKEQKKAYRLLEEICGSDSEGCNVFIKNNRKEVQRVLMKSLNSAAVSSKGARLRCLNYLVKAQPQLDHESKLIKSIIPEAVLCCKDINEKCRATAYEVLNTIGNTLLEHDKMQEFLTLIIAGLAGSPRLISCTILALASVLHNFSGTLGMENIKIILDNICTLMESPTREIVASCLSFIKVYNTTLPSPIVASSLEREMKGLTSMTEDCSRHFRLKIRDILDRLVRKFGADSLTRFVPPTNTVMYKRLRNLRKLNARKKRRKETERDEEDSEDEEFTVKAKPKSVEDILADSDSEFEDMETDELKSKGKKQPKTWIEEDPESIVDFTDPNVSSKITATKPVDKQQSVVEKKKSDKDRGFKTAPDGRLIIKDDSSSDSDDDNKLKFSDDSESEDDSQSKAETVLLTDRKRKRTGSSVKSGYSSSSQPPMKYRTGGVGIHRSLGSTSSVKSGYSTPGSEFKSKKAAGDVKRKGKMDPYAYLPLKRTTLNKRKKHKVAGQFKHIINAAKLGALKGAKAKRNKNK